MKLNAAVLNSSDKVLMRLVALGEGDVSVYENLMSERAGLGSTYLDKLNKAFYQKMSNTGSVSDWVKLTKDTPTLAGVFAMDGEEIVLDKPVYALQENISVGVDGKVHGTLKQVEDWEGFSSVKEEQSGHFICLFVPLPEGTSSAKMNLEDSSKGDVTIDDGIIVIRVADASKKLTITITRSSGNLTRVIDFSELKLL